MDIESIAAIGVLVANGVFIIVTVANYLRMDSHEQRKLDFIQNAMKESKDSGLEMKSAARELTRLIERLERSAAWRRQALTAQGGDEDNGALGAIFEEDEPDENCLRPPVDLLQHKPEAFAEWQRLQQVELDRLLSQRRRLLVDLHASQQKNQESDKLLASFRTRSEQAARERRLLQKMQAQLEQTEQAATEYQALLRNAQTRIEIAERASQHLRRELDLLQIEQADAAAKDRTEMLQRDTETLRSQIEQLEAQLQRSLVEKDFIEEHLLRLDARERDLRLEAAEALEAAAAA